MPGSPAKHSPKAASRCLPSRCGRNLACERRVKDATEALRDDPRPTGVIKVKNADEWRRRLGDYRVTFMVDDSARTVTVAWVGHRRDAYRDLS